MIISVIGLGYIGLPTACILASQGIDVFGVDINEDVVKKINNSQTHIFEPDLDKLVVDVVSKKSLIATTEYQKADVFIITVPTPFLEDNKPDTSFVKDAIDNIAPLLEKGNLIIIESTCPVGTTEAMIGRVSELRSDLIFPSLRDEGIESDISIAYCPERVLPGNILKELVSNDRIIGGFTEVCSKKAERIYKTFIKGSCFLTDAKTAELCKLAENSYRDVNIAFANELSIISDKAGIDPWELINLANKHPRVDILQPGPGVGGHCIAVDPWFIVDSYPDESKLIKTSRDVNNSKTSFVLEKIKRTVKDASIEIKDLSITCLGLSFKPDIGDLRESPAMNVVENLQNMDFKKIFVVEPYIENIPEELNSNIVELIDLDEAIEASDLVIILVKHKSFLNIRLDLLNKRKVIDTVGLIKNLEG
jgi:UDP-N-acetyl-D-mannosaminuronic acid dehydrogenase